jgi:hypothetical protein
MGAWVVRCHHLEIQRVIAAVDVVLDACVRELNVALFVAREVLFASPVPDLVTGQRARLGSAEGVVLAGSAWICPSIKLPVLRRPPRLRVVVGFQKPGKQYTNNGAMTVATAMRMAGMERFGPGIP